MTSFEITRDNEFIKRFLDKRDIARLSPEMVEQLRGCDAFFSVIISSADEKLYRTLGINVCCEPKYEQRRLYHK